MFYDKNGNRIREGSMIKFFDRTYFISKINGDNFGADGCTTLKLDKKPHVDLIPDETNISVIEY